MLSLLKTEHQYNCLISHCSRTPCSHSSINSQSQHKNGQCLMPRKGRLEICGNVSSSHPFTLLDYPSFRLCLWDPVLSSSSPSAHRSFLSRPEWDLLKNHLWSTFTGGELEHRHLKTSSKVLGFSLFKKNSKQQFVYALKVCSEVGNPKRAVTSECYNHCSLLVHSWTSCYV